MTENEFDIARWARCFICNYPEFANISLRVIENAGLISYELLEKRQSYWKKLYWHALDLYTAHCLAVRYNIQGPAQENGINNPMGTGAVTSYSASTSSLSLSNATNSLETSGDPVTLFLSKTLYGLQFLELVYLLFPAGDVVLSVDVLPSHFSRSSNNLYFPILG